MLKKQRYALAAAWLLLFCFIAGQVIVYSHQHHVLHRQHTKETTYPGAQQISEKCKLCDTMHHNAIVLLNQTHPVMLPSSVFVHPALVFDFKSFGLILADGLSPPSFIVA